MDGKLWLIFDSVKTGTEVKLPLNLLFEGKALTLLQKYQGKWSSFFSIKNNSSVNKEPDTNWQIGKNKQTLFIPFCKAY